MTEDLLSPLEDWCVSRGYPSPRGLLMGLGSVVVFQVVVFAYYWFRRVVTKPQTIQKNPPPDSTLSADLWAHLSSPESFLLVFGYLSSAWMLRLLPSSYYDLETPAAWYKVLAQFLVVDFFTFVDHRIEHNWPSLYKVSHKFHHRFINPKLYNAFNGSVPDTVSLILIPLFLTAWTTHLLTPVACWDFIFFGTLYASQFTLIHCEFAHPWDPLLRLLGVGTAADHNVHHAIVTSNYGHFFMYWDRLTGTYKSPEQVSKMRCFKPADLKSD
ncbi:MAG: sterol desaturase family protein [archaeon]|nr:sterol desaturase family protein [archaeon]